MDSTPSPAQHTVHPAGAAHAPWSTTSTPMPAQTAAVAGTAAVQATSSQPPASITEDVAAPPSGKAAPKLAGIAGMAVALQAVRELIGWPLLHAEEGKALGVRWPRGLLLHGPPGCGKTLVVRTVAAEFGAIVHELSASSVFGAYVGESERRVREVFEAAQADVDAGHVAVVFLDEVDALCPRRDGQHQHEARVVAQLLTLLDGAGTQHHAVEETIEERHQGVDDVIQVAQLGGSAAHGHAQHKAGGSAQILSGAHSSSGGADSAQLMSVAPPPDVQAFSTPVKLSSLSVGGDHAVSPEPASATHRTQAYIHTTPSAQSPLVTAAGTPLDGSASKTFSTHAAAAADGPTYATPISANINIASSSGGSGSSMSKKAKAKAKKQASSASKASPMSTSTSTAASTHTPAGASLKGDSITAVAAAPTAAVSSLPPLHAPHSFTKHTGANSQARPRGPWQKGHLVVVAATNRSNALDPALRRPGRFDREVLVSVPNLEERHAILGVHTRGLQLSADVDLGIVASACHGYSGADLAALAREAAMAALSKAAEALLKDPTADISAVPILPVTAADFAGALKRVGPSIVRGATAADFSPVRWEDVGGLDSVKLRLKQAVEWPLQHADTFKRMGLTAPRGVLLHGPPGCSKTTLARAAATASGATLLPLSCAQLFSMYVGEGEGLLRDIFARARMAAPSIIFLDEVDAVAGRRSEGEHGHGSHAEGGQDSSLRLLSTLLTEMDGMELATGVLVLAATNRPAAIDGALMRPGRFDAVLYVPPPDMPGRRQILAVHSATMPLAADVDLDRLAEETDMYTGAELAGLCREAAMAALREDLQHASEVAARHFDSARRATRPTLTPALLAQHESWNTKSGKGKGTVTGGTFGGFCFGAAAARRRARAEAAAAAAALEVAA